MSTLAQLGMPANSWIAFYADFTFSQVKNKTVVLGDGIMSLPNQADSNESGIYRDQPLTPGAIYQISAVVQSSIDGATVTSPPLQAVITMPIVGTEVMITTPLVTETVIELVTTDTPTSTNTAALGGALGAVILLLLVLVVAILLWWRGCCGRTKVGQELVGEHGNNEFIYFI
ncbi:unnamed protein product [Protopolystoma xenopodis]|uniref:Uncharacterized protein n=1 Tax=Protopolystoma xenopodis TaxID=117903 RepID=A0A3S5AAX5_9PLAT|nr:unnamed protein product [Protopolystoma xenopodis]